MWSLLLRSWPPILSFDLSLVQPFHYSRRICTRISVFNGQAPFRRFWLLPVFHSRFYFTNTVLGLDSSANMPLRLFRFFRRCELSMLQPCKNNQCCKMRRPGEPDQTAISLE